MRFGKERRRKRRRGGSGGWLFGDPGVGGVGSDGGRVEVMSNGLLTTRGDDSYGIYAESVGGFGGSGGTSYGFFWSSAAMAEAAAVGRRCGLKRLDGGIATYGAQSHAILAQSIGGGGGSGGGEFGLFASLGGSGNAGGTAAMSRL